MHPFYRSRPRLAIEGNNNDQIGVNHYQTANASTDRNVGGHDNQGQGENNELGVGHGDLSCRGEPGGRKPRP